MLPLAVCSIAAVAVVLERYLFFRRSGATGLADNILAMADSKQWSEAAAMAKTSSLPLIKVMSTGIDNPGNLRSRAGQYPGRSGFAACPSEYGR